MEQSLGQVNGLLLPGVQSEYSIVTHLCETLALEQIQNSSLSFSKRMSNLESLNLPGSRNLCAILCNMSDICQQ